MLFPVTAMTAFEFVENGTTRSEQQNDALCIDEIWRSANSSEKPTLLAHKSVVSKVIS